jgi:type VI secretion system protein ImpG
VQDVNAEAAERLQPGEICIPSNDTPELVTFKNLYTPTMCCQPSIEDDRLWRVLSDLSLNQSSLQNIATLKAMLANYTPQDQRNSLRYLQSMKKINSLIDLNIRPKEILRSHGLLRGLCITLTVKSQDFGSHGEYYLFGCVLDRVFASNAAINTFTEVVFKDFNKGELLSWAPRLGNRPIL